MYTLSDVILEGIGNANKTFMNIIRRITLGNGTCYIRELYLPNEPKASFPQPMEKTRFTGLPNIILFEVVLFNPQKCSRQIISKLMQYNTSCKSLAVAALDGLRALEIWNTKKLIDNFFSRAGFGRLDGVGNWKVKW